MPVLLPLIRCILALGWGLSWRLLLPLAAVLPLQSLGNWLLHLRPDRPGSQPSLGDAIEAIFRLSTYYVAYLAVCAAAAGLLALGWLLPRAWRIALRGGVLLLGLGILLFLGQVFAVLAYAETKMLLGCALLALGLPLGLEHLLARRAGLAKD